MTLMSGQPHELEAQALASAGFRHDPSFAVRDEGDVAFVSDPFEVERIDADDDPDGWNPPIEALGTVVFEPESVGGVQSSFDVAILLPGEGDFVSNDGTWPDSCNTVEEALATYRGYFAPGGALARRSLRMKEA